MALHCPWRVGQRVFALSRPFSSASHDDAPAASADSARANAALYSKDPVNRKLFFLQPDTVTSITGLNAPP